MLVIFGGPDRLLIGPSGKNFRKWHLLSYFLAISGGYIGKPSVSESALAIFRMLAISVLAISGPLLHDK
jgi:hypothetical protein